MCSNPSRDKPKSLKQIVTAPLPNTRHKVKVSCVLGEDHYKGMSRVTVAVARYRTRTAQWPDNRQNTRAAIVLCPIERKGDKIATRWLGLSLLVKT